MSTPSVHSTAGPSSSTAQRFIINIYADRVLDTLPDGLPGFIAAYATAGRLACVRWNAMEWL